MANNAEKEDNLTPKTLYKYTGIKFISSCIDNGVYASELTYLNDPYESLGIEYPEDYRVVCLTKSPLAMLMWAYYGNHQGCCIEYEIDPSLYENNILRPVQYIDNYFDRQESSNEELVENLYYKGSEWDREKEFRAVYYSDNANGNFWKVTDKSIFLKARVKSVTFGLSPVVNIDYKLALQLLIKIKKNNPNDIAIRKCKLQSSRYGLEFDKQFKPEKELAKVKAELDERSKRDGVISREAYEKTQEIISSIGHVKVSDLK